MSEFIYNFILALTLTAADGEVVGHEKVQTFGENYVECMKAKDAYTKNSWTPDKNGITRQPICQADNVLPLAYNGNPPEKPGYAGPTPPVYLPKYGYRSTIYVPNAPNIHIYSNPY